MVHLLLVNTSQACVNFVITKTKSLREEAIVVRKLQEIMRKGQMDLSLHPFDCVLFAAFFLLEVGFGTTRLAGSKEK